MGYEPDPGQDVDLTSDDLLDEDVARSNTSLAELLAADAEDPTTPDATDDIPLHPEGEEVD